MILSLVLPDALHARPANLLVRVAAAHKAEIVISKGGCRGSAKNILDVLSLGAAKGESVELELTGEGVEAAADALRTLVERNFDTDLVPETGIASVDGIAIGRAFVIEQASVEASPGGAGDEPARLSLALERVEREVRDLVRSLDPDEACLFEPEIAIVQALGPAIHARLLAAGKAEEAVRAATEDARTDLILDARSRILEALSGASTTLPPAEERDVIVVTELLTPSLVARLPKGVLGVIAAHDEDAPAGFTSHASILARGRELPLAFVPAHVIAGITLGDRLIVDTTSAPARVWVSPSDLLVRETEARQSRRAKLRAENDLEAKVSLTHLGVHLRANVGAVFDVIPKAADGIGLVRTELLFAARDGAPPEAEQIATLLTIARRVNKQAMVARLFDAGGDKPLAWLRPPADAPHARGTELLFHHPRVLAMQLRSLCRVAESADVSVLLPLARSASDVGKVRGLCVRKIPVGAMIETPEAVERIDEIAEAADFICIGTNDLSAAVLGVRREAAGLSLAPSVLRLALRTIEGAHARGRKVTVCGEMAADERGALALIGLGADALSVPPPRVSALRIALGRETRASCRAVADSILEATR